MSKDTRAKRTVRRLLVGLSVLFGLSLLGGILLGIPWLALHDNPDYFPQPWWIFSAVVAVGAAVIIGLIVLVCFGLSALQDWAWDVDEEERVK
jgi:hypothetical protein